MMKRLGIVITDGVGFRNYILSDFIKEAESKFDRVIIYSFLPKAVYKDYVTHSEIVELQTYQETFYTWFFMKCKEVSHLQLHRKGNFGIQDTYDINKQKSSTVRGYAKRFIYALTKVFHSEKWIQRFNDLQQQTFKSNRITEGYVRQLQLDQVDFLYFTHQRPPYIAPLIYAAEQLNISTGTFIFSWDNLASKGRMAGNFDHYFVWSHLMKSELLTFYKSVDASQIHVVGTPQFEPYVLERYKTTQQDFSAKFNLEPQMKTICFSCGDVSTSKNDPIYIEAIANAIQSQEIKQQVNFLVRTSPAETPERFQYLKEKFPFIVWNYPEWPLRREGHQETWSQRVPTFEDMVDLRSILENCDVFINMCSTMSLDAMCFDKPVINPVFGNNENGLYNDQRFLNYTHYKRVAESGAVAIVKNGPELVAAVNIAMSNPKLRLEAQKELLQLQISCELRGTSERISETIKASLQ
ncbi:hypothetical protein LX77_01521 [Gelidibacter algens]|uniref:UDP-glycosyltransferase n=1 Tax=Gelidibacter algens TaxID=49280 RepID=A0A327S833_9FLAO|nr:hypothetical protein [Gelidibacter algens]RAJ25219.1 hypothetical protein LX77_01521 [Gelidibacter algens]